MKATISPDELRNDLQTVIDKMGGYPSRSEYKKYGGRYSETPFIKNFGSWGQAIRKIGGQPLKGKRKILSEPELSREIYNKFFHITNDRVIVAFDPHIPYHCPDIINEMCDIAEAKKIKTLVIGGDFLDFKSLYMKEVQTTKMDWTEEIEEACKVLENLTELFDNIYIIKGNHDHRLTRLLGNDDRAGRLYKLIFQSPKVHFSKYQFMYINDDWQIIHSGNSRVKLSKLERVVNVTRKSTIVGHSHRWALGIHDSGKEVLGEGLHLTRPEFHEYKSLVRNDYSEWIQGFWIIQDNKLYPYVKHPKIGNIIEGNIKKTARG